MLSIERPGLAIMREGDRVHEFVHFQRRITADRPQPAIIAKLEQVAALLHGKVIMG